MKKKIVYVLLIITLGIGQTDALSTQQQTQIKQLVSLIEQQKPNMESKLQTLKGLYNLLTVAYKKANTDNNQIIAFARNHIAERISEKMSKQEGRYPETIQNWIDKHNTVRQTPLQPHPLLMDSAQTRADHLSTNKIKSNTHRRIHGNYNYADIENRFYQQGIIFENKERVTFSESIAYGTIRCNENDCDQKLKQETLKSWDFLYTTSIPNHSNKNN